MKSWEITRQPPVGDTVLTEREGAVAIVTLNRPKCLNALNFELADALGDAMHALEADPEVRCVVLRGAGGHFLAGGDIDTFAADLDAEPAERAAGFRLGIHAAHAAVIAMRRMPKPVVASVDGAAAGAGLSFALAADLAILSDRAYLATGYLQLGTTPDCGLTFTLPRALGTRKAMELLMLAERIDAQTALALGLANRVVPAGEIDAETRKLARRLAAGPTIAFGQLKQLMRESARNGLDAQLAAEIESFSVCALSEDFKEGVRAFEAKRPPRFEGR
ncbi:MAG: enoyl-CoA hydratase/isomerase family protein [Betaproteobacteria bacterium]|jgi:2-(1,2-epoxy-1,2-dihydrophenyl)acetyl-CoA isomerase|nr:enoyl-CoA hydratase/isomerase family protein [Betaproteobacteria bacterium]